MTALCVTSFVIYPQRTFKSISPLWTTRKLLNERKVVQSLDDIEEAKFEAFNSVRFKSICYGLEYAGTKRWLHLPIGETSLLHMFNANKYVKTRVGKSAWRSLVPNSSMQINCNREGINVKQGESQHILARIGIASNNENDCKSSDSVIGSGFDDRRNYCGPIFKLMSSGNVAGCTTDNGAKALPANSYLLVK